VELGVVDWPEAERDAADRLNELLGDGKAEGAADEDEAGGA